MFYVGQKVVCVKADGNYGFGRMPDPHYLVRGKIYVIRGTGFSPQFDEEHIPVVWLEGVERVNLFGQDVGYAAERFRPVVERKTDISIFTDMLKPKHVEVQA